MNKAALSFFLIMGFALATGATAGSSKLQMQGLALHQETGRNIYIGAIHASGSQLDTNGFIQAPPPRIMEYRVIARRTSVRSLLGNMLLQSEVANDAAPGPEVSTFADDILSSVKGSLYQGDAFELRQQKSGHVAAYLNDVEMASSEHSAVFDYLMLGWLHKNGPSTAFHNNITQAKIDSSLLSIYQAHNPSDERIASIEAWSAAAGPVELTSIIPSSKMIVPTLTVAKTVSSSDSEPEVVATELPEQVASVDTSSDVLAPVAKDSQDSTTTEPDTLQAPETDIVAEEPIQVAFAAELSATDAGLDIASEPTENALEASILQQIQELDVKEYSHRLALFNTTLIKLVYSKIRYPKQAVRRDIQGALELDVTVLKDGSLVEVAVAESSGYRILDGAALKAAENALERASLGQLDPVAVAEYGNEGKIVVPVPVHFILQ